MHARPAVQQLDSALSRWENEGDARSRKPQSWPRTPLQIRQAMNTELEHLRIRMIAMENLLIALLSQSPDGQLELGCEMAAFISPRPGFTHHRRTVGTATHMAHLLHR
jgi:hypothetical protein